MQVVILAGGYGTRLSEETDFIPKPMVKIGHMPILIHIMKYFYSFGHRDFLIALGYKAEIIKEYHDVKVTDTLIESYLELASSNVFSVDPVICELRKINKLDCLVEGKLNYTLGDGSVVAINETTQDYLNKVLQNQTEIIEYMREGKDNFLHVLEQLEG